jgi:CheY-like chemotaxis protein
MSLNITCFLIDDDVDDQDIFILALEEVDSTIRCHLASDGVEALQKLKEEKNFRPDYIFLDLNIPRMNGRQCLAAIKEVDFLRDIPVVMYSTSSDQKDITETKQLGAADYIVKPNTVSALADILARFFHVSPQNSSWK